MTEAEITKIRKVFQRMRLLVNGERDALTRDGRGQGQGQIDQFDASAQAILRDGERWILGEEEYIETDTTSQA